VELDSRDGGKEEIDTEADKMTCPQGHKFPNGEVFHAPDAHYCMKCDKWYADKDVKK